MPIPVVASSPRRSRGAAVRLAVVVAAGVIALLITATTAVVFVVRGTAAPAAPVIVAAPVTPAPVVTPVAAPAVPVEPGPALVDTNGKAVDPEFGAVVTRVYRALDSGDLEPVRRAYSAAGSDDWITSEAHLRKSSVRSKVLAALRTAPSPGDGYRYAVGSYAVQFGQGEGYPVPGLWTIDGPWNDEAATTSTSASSSSSGSLGSSPSASAPATIECGGGSVAVPTEGHLCQDPETGRGVDIDGTVGVHGLKPCPYGTEVPSDPNEPTRNASTGEICGI